MIHVQHARGVVSGCHALWKSRDSLKRLLVLAAAHNQRYPGSAAGPHPARTSQVLLLHQLLVNSLLHVEVGLACVGASKGVGLLLIS